MLKWIKRLICKHKGHDWMVYPYYYNKYDSIPEMAGECKRCGANTHG